MAEGQGRSSEQGVKLLYIRDYLHKYTNKEHPKSAKDIIEYLASKGIKAERKTIYNDILRLQMDFQEPIEYNPKKWGYYITEPEFDTRDLRILMDCIQYADFVTMEESTRLIGKVKELGSVYDKELFDRPMEEEVKDSKAQKSVFKNIEIIAQAIREKKKISFHSLVFVADRTKHTKVHPEVHIVSPHKISWSKDTHILSYAADLSDRDKDYDPDGIRFLSQDGLKERIYNYCDISPMCDIRILSAPSIYNTAEQDVSLQDYESKLDRLYGKKRAVTIQFANCEMRRVLDELGDDAILIPVDHYHFKTTVMKRTGPRFQKWLYTYGINAKILSPQDVIDNYRSKLHTQLLLLQERYSTEELRMEQPTGIRLYEE